MEEYISKSDSKDLSYILPLEDAKRTVSLTEVNKLADQIRELENKKQ